MKVIEKNILISHKQDFFLAFAKAYRRSILAWATIPLWRRMQGEGRRPLPI
jgi:hypothetical protein